MSAAASASSATWQSRRKSSRASATSARPRTGRRECGISSPRRRTRKRCRDLDATVAWAKGTGKADANRLGITGFCRGGRAVWLYAAHNPDVKAAVAWYGPLAFPVNELHPKNAIDVAADLKAPVLGLYGGAAPVIPVEHVEKLKAALAAAKKPSEIVIYPDTPHAFNADYRPSYRPEAAKDGWNRMLAWFKKYGVA